MRRGFVLVGLGAMAAAALVARRVEGGMPREVRIPIVRTHGKGDPKEAALFSHWSHDQYPCYACHPSIFPQGRVGFTHDDLDAGKYCAVCHNGKKAFSVDDAECETCHRP
jgi:c(7)-type cytochrome triheme protein